MNKLLLASAMAAVISAGASAKTADELRIYINPGHGGWTPNDRPCVILGHQEYTRYNTDTTSFFESNTDLEKGFGVLERMIQYGLKFDRTLNQTGDILTTGAARDLSNNVVMSRVKNGPFHDDNGTANQLGDATPADIYAFNRNLSEICEEVESNNFDMFISIHSNAATDGSTSNYPLFLYRGYDTPVEGEGTSLEQQNTSIEMAKKCWGYAYENTHAQWSYYSMTNMNIRGDINFYGSGSTATRENGNKYKGYLGVLKHGAPGFLVEGYFHTYQPARHRAMNWDVCRLEGTAYARGIADYFGLTKEKTGLIYGIVRDRHEKISETYYKPNATTDDLYYPINGATIVLKKNGEKVAEYTTDNSYNGAFVFEVDPGEYTVEITHPNYKAADPISVSVKAASSVYPTAFLESNDYVPPTEVLVDFPDPAAELGYIPCDEINFKQEFVDNEIEALAGKTVKRAIYNDGNVYILAHDADMNATVVKYDTETKEATTLSTEGIAAVSGGVALSDIAVTTDHVLIGMNACPKAYGKASSIAFYRWKDGKPSVWFDGDAANAGGNWSNGYAGESMCYRGTTEEGKMYYSGRNAGADNKQIRTIVVTIVNGVYSSTCHNQTSEDLYGKNVGDFMITAAPTEGNVYYATQNVGVKEFTIPVGTEVPTLVKSFDLGNQNAAISSFLYGGSSFIAAADIADGKNAGVKLYDASAASEIATSNTAIEAADGLGTVAAVVKPKYDALDVLQSASIDIYDVRAGKISKFTTSGADAVKRLKEFAYDLKQTVAEDKSYVLSYSVTGDVPAAQLILTPTTEGENIVIDLGAVEKGEHTYTIDPVTLGDKNYNWAVKVESRAIPALAENRSEASGESSVRAGLVAFTDPEQDAFGRVLFAHGQNNGIDIYDAAGNKLVDRALKNADLLEKNTGNASNPMNGCERQGKAVLAAWGDGASGLVVVDPMNVEAGMTSFYEGTKNSKGLYVNDGVNVGGGTPAVCFVGEGENQRLYTFSEDHENLNGKGDTENTMVYYPVGSAWTVGVAPTVVGFHAFLLNTCVDYSVFDGGIFASQCRGEGNNIKGCPGFGYFYNDELVFDSSDLGDLTSCSAGLDITKDGKKLAVASYSGLRVYDVEWNDHVPSFKLNSTASFDKTETWSVCRFDAAGNVHVYGRVSGKYSVYGLPEANPEYTTPAKASMLLIGAESGVQNIAVDAAANEGDAVYYNLNGVRVSADNLTQGVYVKVVGNTASKVLVK